MKPVRQQFEAGFSEASNPCPLRKKRPLRAPKKPWGHELEAGFNKASHTNPYNNGLCDEACEVAV